MILHYFSSKFCGPCKIIKPQVIELCKNHGITFIDYSAEDDFDEFTSFKVNVVPTIILVEHDSEIFRGELHPGFKKLVEFLDNLGE